MRSGAGARRCSSGCRPGMRNELRKETARLIAEARQRRSNNVQLSRCDWDHSLDGKRLGDVTKGRGFEPTIDNAADTVFWIVEGRLRRHLPRDRRRRSPAHPAASATMIASDGGAVFGQASPHPATARSCACSSATCAATRRSRWRRRSARCRPFGAAHRSRRSRRAAGRPESGHRRVRPGHGARHGDLRAAHQYAEGVTKVNGQVVFDAGRMTDARPGRILYGPARRRPRGARGRNGKRARKVSSLSSVDGPRILPPMWARRRPSSSGRPAKFRGARNHSSLADWRSELQPREHGQPVGGSAESLCDLEGSDKDVLRTGARCSIPLCHLVCGLADDRTVATFAFGGDCARQGAKPRRRNGGGNQQEAAERITQVRGGYFPKVDVASPGSAATTRCSCSARCWRSRRLRTCALNHPAATDNFARLSLSSRSSIAPSRRMFEPRRSGETSRRPAGSSSTRT